MTGSNYNQENTKQLQQLIETEFNTTKAMKLIAEGANPNILSKIHKASLVHLIAQEPFNKNIDAPALEQLVNTYKIDIESKNASNHTALQTLMIAPLNQESISTLLDLKANPNTLTPNGDSLIHILIRENYNHTSFLQDLVNKYKVDIHMPNAQNESPLEQVMNSEPFNPDLAIQLISLGAKADSLSKKGQSLIHLLLDMPFTQESERYITQLVHDFALTIHIRNKQNQTPLKYLLCKDSLSTNKIMTLIKLGADPNTQDTKGLTCLHNLTHPFNNAKGIMNSYIEELVHTYNADINQPDSSNYSPLELYLTYPELSTEAIMHFVRNKAKPDTKTRQGNSLLHLIVKEPFDPLVDSSALKELVTDFQLDINTQNEDNKTPLEYILESSSFSHHAAMALLELGADPKSCDQYGNTLLHLLPIMCENKQIDLQNLEQLVNRYKIPIDALNKSGSTPLKYLLNQTFIPEIAILLVELGANPNTLNQYGYSLLHILTLHNQNRKNDTLIERLIQNHGVSPNLFNSSGLSPLAALMNATKFNPNTAMMLVELGALASTLDKEKNNLIHKLVLNNKDKKNNDWIRKLNIHYHLYIDQRNQKSETPLQLLLNATELDAETALLLVRLKADPNTKDCNGNSLLLRLVLENTNGKYNELIKELVITHKANISIHDSNGYTPIQVLFNKEHKEQKDIELLLQLGADPNSKNKNGNSLLHYFVQPPVSRVDKEFVKKLVLTYWADINIKNKENRTPLQCIGITESSKEIADLLFELGADPETINSKGEKIKDLLYTRNSGIISGIMALFSPKKEPRPTIKQEFPELHDNSSVLYDDPPPPYQCTQTLPLTSEPTTSISPEFPNLQQQQYVFQLFNSSSLLNPPAYNPELLMERKFTMSKNHTSINNL